MYLNKPFKDRTRADWNKWMVDGEKSFTKGGNMRAPDLTVVASWVKHAWEQIPKSMVKRSFKCCGISNALDGTEDDAIWEEDGAEAAESADEEDGVGDDVYDDQISYEQMKIVR